MHDSVCDVDCRKVRLQIKDETEREESEIKAVHAEKLRKLQQEVDQQLTEEKSKIRYISCELSWNLAVLCRLLLLLCV